MTGGQAVRPRWACVVACALGLLASSAAAAASGWMIQPTASYRSGGSVAADNLLEGVSCPTLTFCVAAGFFADDDDAIAEMWDGTAWSAQQLPVLAKATGSEFGQVSCSSATACTAVGFYTNGDVDRNGGDIRLPLIERWDGTSWRRQTPPAAGPAALLDVTCPTDTDCLIVGGDGHGLLAARWDGTRWSRAHLSTSAADRRPDAGLVSLSCASRSFCAAIGFAGANDLFARWNGTRWSLQTLPEPRGGALSAISCVSPRACMAVGWGVHNRTLAELWNGSRWSILTTPTPAQGEGPPVAFPTGLGSVSCETPTSCIAVGASSGFDKDTSNVLVEAWDGARWSLQSAPSPDDASELNDVSCTSTMACTAVGSDELPDNNALAERYTP